jgi:hypothetical protein
MELKIPILLYKVLITVMNAWQRGVSSIR